MQIATADWHGPVPNVGHGGRSVRLVVVHIMSGTLEGTDAWFHNPASQVSADTGTGKDGRLWQWDDPSQEIAWAQAAFNGAAISIENEGQSGDLLTDAQIQRCGEVLAWAHKTYGVPLEIASGPAGAGLIGHGQLGVAGGNHPNCPGNLIVGQFPQIIAAASPPAPHKPPVTTPIVGDADVASRVDFQVRTDANGDGFTDLPGVDAAKIISVIPNGQNPVTGGYHKVFQATPLNINGAARIPLVTDAPNAVLDVHAFVTA